MVYCSGRGTGWGWLWYTVAFGLSVIFNNCRLKIYVKVTISSQLTKSLIMKRVRT